MVNGTLSYRKLNRKSWIVLSVVVLGLTLSLSVLLLNVHQEQRRQQQEFREDFVWFLTQVEREGAVFIQGLHLYHEQPTSANLGSVRTAFDIFWSRIYYLDKGDLGKYYLALPNAFEALLEFKALLVRLEPLVATLETAPGDGVKQILAEMDRYLPNIHEMAKLGSAYNLQRLEQRRDRFQKLYFRALLLLFGATLSGAFLVYILLRQQKSLDQLAHRLSLRVQDQSADLESSHRQLRLLSQAIEQSPTSVIICNQAGEIEYVNAQFERISGYSGDEVIGFNPRVLKSGKTPTATFENIWANLTAGKDWRGELCNKRKNGEIYWEYASISPIIDTESGTTRYLAVMEDITLRKQVEEQLFRQANFDSLTQLPNRTLAMDRLEQAIRRAKRRGELAGLLFIDLDNFKQVNDSLGHEGGDRLLSMAAERLSGCLRECDTAARFGGDEFIAILSELKTRQDAHHILERILEAFSQPFAILGTSLVTTASIGLSYAPDDGDSPAELLKKADSAMYVVKGSGKSGYCIFGTNSNKSNSFDRSSGQEEEQGTVKVH